MLFQLVSKFGENLVQNGYAEGLGFIDVAATVRFVIDAKGAFLRAERICVKTEERKRIPIGVYSESFSDAEEKVREYTHSLFEHLYVQKEEAVRTAYYEKLGELAMHIGDEKLSAIIRFIMENNLYTLAGQAGVTDEKDYFCVVIESGSGIYEVWKDEEMVTQIGDYILRECSTGSSETDIYGRRVGKQINKHSRVLGNGSIRARAVSQKVYNDFYGGDVNSNRNACCIGSLSEIFFNHGLNVIKDNGYVCGGCIMYLGDINSPFCIPFDWSVTGFNRYFEKVYGEKLVWKQLKEFLKERTRKTKLFFVAFDNVNRGRISTYKSYMFNEVESHNIICNILTWIDKSTIYVKGKPCFSFYTHIYERVIWNEKNIGKKKNTALFFCESIMRWEISRLWDIYFPRAIRETVHEMDKRRLWDIIKISRQLWERDDAVNIWEDDILILSNNISVSYLGGLYLACVYLLEKRLDYAHNVDAHRMSIVEKRSECFRLHPLEEMNRLREMIERRMKKEKIVDINKYAILLNKMRWLESMLHESELPWKLSGEMYVAFDIAISQYWQRYEKIKQDSRQEEEYGI